MMGLAERPKRAKIFPDDESEAAMPSPFPGMDPYLEEPASWPDVHQRLITYLADDLQSGLPRDYIARIGERVYLVEPERNVYPDVALLQRPIRERRDEPVAVMETPSTPTVIREPLTMILPSGEYREPFVEIRHGREEVVTVIEVLSPANKTAGEGYAQYRRKQREVMRSHAHLVEIDLLNRGLFVLACSPDSDERPPTLPLSRYLICVSRWPERWKFEAYPLILPEPLPSFRIPLKAPDPDVVLNLQAAFDRCYDNGRYMTMVDYSQPPPAPLSLDEQHWVKTNLFKPQA
jgi:hypothetical protein